MGLPLEQVKKRVASLPNSSVILYTTVTTDGIGYQYLPNEALAEIAKTANRPIVVDVDNRLGHGATGGFVVVPTLIGEEAAQLMLRVFNGENASTIPITTSNAVKPVFDWRELQRWAVNERDLPPGSEILFRPPTTWEQYRWQILFIAAVILTQALLIMGLLFEHQRRRRAERQSAQRMTELARMNRIATVSELSASIAHELKQPLASIVTSGSAGLRWLARQVPDVDEVRTNLQRMIDEGNRASVVIDELRAMFRKDNNRQTLVDVNRLILDTLSLTNHEIQAQNISVQTSLFESSTLLVLADQVQLQQVILNLIVNAIEAMNFMPDARKLRITSALHEADGVLITVEDSGSGIAPENIDKVFDTFFTTKPTGMGMGLSICHSIIEAHGGRLWASGAVPHGCIFHVVLPKAHRK